MANAKGAARLVLPPQFSKRIFYMSFFGLASVIAAAYNDCHCCLVCAVCVFVTSINYWRHPTLGVRRNVDMVTCAISLAYQMRLAVTTAGPAP